MNHAAQVGGQGRVRLLAIQPVEGLQGGIETALAQVGADKQQVRDRSLVGCRNLLQLRQPRLDGALGELAQRKRGAASDVARVHLGSARKVGLRAFCVTPLQEGLSRQRECLCVGFTRLQQRRQHLERLVGVTHLHIGARQQAPRRNQLRRQQQGLCEKGLGLHVRPGLQRDRTGELQYGGMVRRCAQQLLRDFLRGLEVLVDEGKLGLEIHCLQLVRGDLLQLGELAPGAAEVLLREQNRQDARMRRRQVAADLQRLAVRPERRRCVTFHEVQQVTLELPGLVVVGILSQNVVDQRERTIDVARFRFEPGLQQARRRVLGCSAQGGG